jgi:mono/diheme cytochrome c family protein
MSDQLCERSRDDMLAYERTDEVRMDGKALNQTDETAGRAT